MHGILASFRGLRHGGGPPAARPAPAAGAPGATPRGRGLPGDEDVRTEADEVHLLEREGVVHAPGAAAGDPGDAAAADDLRSEEQEHPVGEALGEKAPVHLGAALDEEAGDAAPGELAQEVDEVDPPALAPAAQE